MPKERSARASRAASEALTGSRKRTIERLVDEATGDTQRATGSPTRSTLQRGTGVEAARRSERLEDGVRTFGAPVGRMRDGQSSDSNQ